MLLNNIEGNGSDMVVPNMYVAEGAASTLNLACYFVNGENLTYTCTSGDTTVASVSVNGTFMTVSGGKNRCNPYYSESKQWKRTIHYCYRSQEG